MNNAGPAIGHNGDAQLAIMVHQARRQRSLIALHCTLRVPHTSLQIAAGILAQALHTMPQPSLAAALSKIDELIAALQSGALISSGAAAAPQPAAAAPKPAAAAAASKPAAAAAPKPAAPKEGKAAKKAAAKEAKKAEGGGGAAAAAPEGDAFSKAHLAVGRVASVHDHPSGSEKLWLCKVDIGGGKERQASGQARAGGAAGARRA